ncbi:M48 family metallopeptidase [Qipengyuania sp. YG27]|uniref:M48 family metallopeptidase n=1 Tax=Qipengyuania mesophila TaxID=2867246 RepID=A0ABS7JSH3_9SPHN|nr:M48 family metallopeptidase [Qipengyuania mesophila]
MIDWLRREALEPVIELGTRTLPIEITRNRRAKRLTLRLAPDGNAVRITLPHWCRSAEAIAFAHARRDWLAAQLAKVPDRRDPAREGALLYRGSEIALDWREDAPRKPALSVDTLRIGGPQDTLGNRLQRWLEAEALRLFAEDAAEYCNRAELAASEVRLTRARRRWGSCSSEGTLRLNWRLVQAPDHVRRSVVAHEVAHLVHFDHSPAFHALLDRLYEDDIDEANRWLSQHGRTLYAAFG